MCWLLFRSGKPADGEYGLLPLIELVMCSQLNKNDSFRFLPINGTPVSGDIDTPPACILFAEWMISQGDVIWVFKKGRKRLTNCTFYIHWDLLKLSMKDRRKLHPLISGCVCHDR